MRIIRKKGNIVFKRVICVILAIELCLIGLPVPEHGFDFGGLLSAIVPINAHAAGTGTPVSISSPSALENYSRNYNASHKNDILTITFSNSATTGGLKDFKKIGSSAEDAFNGTIVLAGSNITLNLPTTMFGYITDDVNIVDSSGNPVELTISRIYDKDNQPLFADHVVHTRSSGSPVEWKFHYDRYVDTESNYALVVHKFAGYIGTLDENAKVNVSSVVHDNSNGTNVSKMSASGDIGGDIGLVCCTMAENSELTVGSISLGSNGNSGYGIESESGNAGGIVGSMANNSELTLGSGIVNCQGAGQTITAENGYAGGIVGKCDGGSIVFNNSSYSLSQVINGKSGSGGVIGYYKTKASTDVTVSTAKFNYNGYKVNGDGNCGALFGELVNNGGAITVSGSTNVVSDHNSGSAASLGGLIGTYTATNLSDSLTISTTGTVTPSKSGGSAKYYGGAIGVAGANSYVNLNSFIVNAPNAENFGGAAGMADGAFIDVNGITVTGPSGGFSGGGVINALGDGVLRLNGTINLTNAKANGGQIVNTRDYGLVFAESWTLTRCSSIGEVDDIGSWGEVLRFPSGVTEANVITNTSTISNDHYVTLAPAVLSMGSTKDFVRTALNMQLNKGQNSGVLRCSGDTSATLLASSGLELSGSSVSIDLSGTGITGLTRDNGTSCVEFSGTFDGKGGSIKLAVGESYSPDDNGTGHGKIYNHSYIGLFAKTKNATVQNLNIAKDSSIKVKANTAMYIGNIIGQASGTLTLDTVEICHGTSYATIDAGGSASYIGGFVGEFTATGNSSITGCTYNGEIKGAITGSKIGGMIGSLSGGNDANVTIESSYVKGKITGSSNNEVGGTIAVTSGSTITIDNLDIDGLVMSGGTSCGGFLGYEWLTTDVEFTASKGLEVKNSASLATGVADAAGLVKTASGYWKVNANGITLYSTMSVNASSATTFGLLVNDGTALYMELLPSAYSVASGVSFTMDSVTVFDELVAKTISTDDKLANGQGIVSVATTNHALLKMDSYGGTGSTYQHQTNFLRDHSTLINNPNTRYYYNLDNYNSSSITDPAQQLLMWSVRQYANSAIQSYFKYTGTSIGSGASSSLDMAGYSYYPIDLTDSLTLKGAVHLYNAEFDTTEGTTTDTRLSKESSGSESQHYMIHNSLFRNVSGSLNFTGSLDGTVRKIDNYCGAMVMGNVGSDVTASPAKITVNSLELKGVNIAGAAGPLIINTASSNSTLNISGVSNTNAYSGMGAGASTYIATSLLGNIGAADATGVKLTFSNIKLDGRNSTGCSNLSGLTSVYNTNGSLFSQATLAKSLAYAPNSGSFGVYNYTYDEDWGTSTPRNVTYGAEIDSTDENLDDSVSPAVSKQLHYNDDPDNFTRPDSASSIVSKYGQFETYFQKYVHDGYVPAYNKHELRVNIPGNESSGCGTYNDPYIITSGTDLEMFASIINGTNTESQTISVPSEVVANPAINQTWHNGHITFTIYTTSNTTWSNSSSDTISNDNLRKYLAGAYYKVDKDITTDITLPSTFSGLSAAVAANASSEYVFRGVIDGSGKTIINESTQPLIVSSNGSVVYNLELKVAPASAKSLNQTTNATFKSDNTGCEFYGAVMGQIFGGDNIIDNVDVIFPDSNSGNQIVVNANGKDKAHLVPIGGYVGVVVNGGLIFRNMSGGADNNQGGITASNLSGFGEGVGNTPSDPTASDNTKWLYVNPIIGRVLNGYAVTESTSYKPFEDGSRTYPDGSKEYWQSNGPVVTKTKAQLEADPTLDETMLESAAHVTMQNGTKNYSIADISTSDTSSFGMTGIADNSNINIGSAQALYIMSLITQCGLGKSMDGHYMQKYVKDGTSDEYQLKPYDAYMSTHLGNYHEIGSSDANTSGHDYYDSAKNDTYYSSWSDVNEKTIIPYIIKTYTPESGGIYPAFDCGGGWNGSEIVYYNLSFSGCSGSLIYLPDGYRGLGALMFGVKDPSVNILYGVKISKDKTNLDNFKENVIFLYGMDGANKTISMHMELLVYYDDNCTTLSGSQSYFKTGFGLIDSLQSDYNDNDSRKFKDLTIIGSVKFELLNLSDGLSIDYTSTNIQSKYIPAVAALAGVPVAKSSNASDTYDVYFENIMLDRMELSGVRYAGGIVGALNVSGTFNFSGCSADDLKIFSGGAAGGLMGYMRNGSANVNADFKNKEFGIISIVSAASNSVDIGDSSFAGAGGILGHGGRTTNMTLDNVTIKNLNVCGITAGGVVGHIDDDTSCLNISNTNVITDTTPIRCRIQSTGESADKKYTKSSGGFVGRNLAKLKISITDSKLSGYRIMGTYNVGGLIGYNDASAEPNTIIKNVELSEHTLIADNTVGGLVGYQKNGGLSGYNIRIYKQTSPMHNNNNGYILGNNVNGQTIKIVGFSRQEGINCDRMVGNVTATSANRYGSDGYVIFADYNDTAGVEPPSVPNTQFANMKSSYYLNVGSYNKIGSKTIITEYTVVAQRTGVGNTLNNDTITVIGDPVRTVKKSETPDDNLDAYDDTLPPGENLASVTGTRLRYEPYVKQNVSSTTGLNVVDEVDDLIIAIKIINSKRHRI